MMSNPLNKWVSTSDPLSVPDVLLNHQLCKYPYGYIIGVVLWPVFFLAGSIWIWLSFFLFNADVGLIFVVGGFVTVGAFVTTTLSSAIVMSVTAWNTPKERISRELALLFASLLLAVLLFGLYLSNPTFPYRFELGLSAFVAHELSKIVFLGPATGFAFVSFPLAILVYRIVHS